MTGTDAFEAPGRVYPIATICGAMRLHQDMLTVADELTRQGHIVQLPLTRKDESSLRAPTPITAEQLDSLHRAKIDMADVVIFVTGEKRHPIDSGSTALYFGESTAAEWAYAESLGKVMKVVRLQRHPHGDTVVWIDQAALEGPAAAASAVGMAAPRAGGRRPANGKPRRAVSARTFRID